MKIWKFLAPLVLCLVLVLVLLSTTANAATVDSGTCGDNLTWTLDDSGTLTICGVGPMKDFLRAEDVPWRTDSSSIKKVVISDGVTAIGNYAFQHWNMTTVFIPNSVTSIGEQAFYGSGLTSVTIPDGVTHIGPQAFAGSPNLTYNVHDNIRYLGNDTNPHFALIEPVTSDISQCELHPSTKLISSNAFSNCRNLTTVTVPGSVEIIDRGAFQFSSITTVTMGNGVTTIGDYAFANSSIHTVTMGINVTTIGEYAFNRCTYLTDLSIPDSVTHIGSYALEYCNKLNYTTYDNAKYLGNSVNPHVVLVEATSKTLSQCQIHPMTRLIYEGAFSGCDQLKTTTIPFGVVTIGDYAFENCTALANAAIPGSVVTIGYCAFYNCSSLSQAVIPGSVKTISQNAFNKCSGLTMVTIPDSVTTLGMYAFMDCRMLTTLTIGKGITVLEDGVFSGCSSLTAITIPDSVAVIDQFAFINCSRLASVTIPNSVTAINYTAFSGCDNLVFNNYDSAQYLGNENNPYHALIKAADTTIAQCQIHPDTHVIAAGAFENCGSLTSVVIPDGVETVGVWAFYNCKGLAAVTIPDSVTTIYYGAFGDCSSLADVYYDGSKADWQTIKIHEQNDSLLQANLHFSEILPGDMDGDEELTTDDAVYLLLTVLFGEEDYPVPEGVSLDFDGSGAVDTDDAVYLLLNVLFGEEDYPLSA